MAILFNGGPLEAAAARPLRRTGAMAAATAATFSTSA